MRINNNQAATNTHRIMNKTMGYQAKVSEKLASGLRINRAADDASGLAISEKMRAQKRGLNMASRNCTDGISLVQTAEGGLTEMSEILQRIRELSVQSATGTYTAEDRVAMQDEANELIKELDSISTETKFNKKSLLDGKIDKDGNFVPTGSLAEDVQHITPDGGTTEKYEKDGVSYASAVIDFSNINSAKDMANLVGKGTNYTYCTCTKAYSIKFIDWEPDISGLGKDNPVMEVDIRGLTGGTELARKIMETAAGSEFVNHYSKIAVEGGKLYIYDERPDKANESWPSGGMGAFKHHVYGEPESDEDTFVFIDIQAGSNEYQDNRIAIPNVIIKKLGMKDLLMDTQKNATLAITKVDNAISRVSAAC